MAQAAQDQTKARVMRKGERRYVERWRPLFGEQATRGLYWEDCSIHNADVVCRKIAGRASLAIGEARRRSGFSPKQRTPSKWRWQARRECRWKIPYTDFHQAVLHAQDLAARGDGWEWCVYVCIADSSHMHVGRRSSRFDDWLGCAR